MAETLRTLVARWPSVLLGVTIGALVAGLGFLTATPLYTTETRFFVATTDAVDLYNAVQGSTLALDRIDSYAEYLTDQQMTSAVISDLGLPMTPNQLRERITATVVPDTVIISVTVTDSLPARAAAIAESIDTQFPLLVRRLETPQGGTQSPVKVTITAEPEVPTGPSEPSVAKYLVLGLVLGLVGGVCLALWRERSDDRLRHDTEAASIVDAPLLAVIPKHDDLARRTVWEPSPPNGAGEALRRLRTNLTSVNSGPLPRVVAVTSATPQEGRTTVATNLAVSLSRTGQSVLLVDGDLRGRGVTTAFGLTDSPGLVDVLEGRVPVDVACTTVDVGDLHVLPTGLAPSDPGDVLVSSRMGQVLEELRSRYDTVLIDTPALLPVADTGELARGVDGVLLCVRLGVTRRTQLETTRTLLERVGTPIIGVVVTMAPASPGRAVDGRRSRFGRLGSWRFTGAVRGGHSTDQDPSRSPTPLATSGTPDST
jgi:non-specific protein-tyrosine kinase